MKAVRFGYAAIAAVAAYTSFAGAHADTRVGVASAVNPSAAGTPPGADTRQLTVGGDIIFRERVVTTTDGQAQILFLDQSSLLIGPNSTVVIDEFVYDPATNKGNIAATLTQGSFRYIGGKLSKQGNATLKTPVATLGIRGSDVTIGYDSAKNQTDIVTTHGSANVETGGNVINLRSGFGLTVGGNTQPGPPTALTAAQIAAANTQFEGQPGKNGGAGKPPTDGDVAKSGLGSTVEAQGLASVAPAAGNGSSNPPNANVPFMPSNNDTPPKVLSQPADPPPPPPPPPPNLSVPDQPSVAPNRELNGYIAGLGSAQPSSSSYVVGNRNPSDVELRFSANGSDQRVLALWKYRTEGAASPVDVRAELGDTAGGPTPPKSIVFAGGSFIATEFASAAAGKASFGGTPAGVAGTVASGGIAPLCTCEFVTWGAWDLSIRVGDGVHNASGFWVAGKLPEVSDPSPQGRATFSGTAIGMVYDTAHPSTSVRTATGQFTNDYNFSQRSGTVAVSGFDGKSFGGTVNAGSDWRSYSGAVSGSYVTGTLNGSFFGNRTASGVLQTPKETAGNFNVSGRNYSASGVFVGAR